MDTQIVRIDLKDSASDALIARAADIIKNGGLVVFPTETVYGLGADAESAEAAMKIYAAKGRPSDNPLIIHISKPEDAEKYAYTNSLYYELAKRYMPGELTVILKAKSTVPEQTRGGLPTVAIRCPRNRIANRLIELSNRAIAAPSANLSGSPSPTHPTHVIDDMRGRVDMIIDGGECEVGLESTIVKIDDVAAPVLLRPGKITAEELSAVMPALSVADAVVAKLADNERVLSPGMKYRHYAPKAPLTLIDGDAEALLAYIKQNASESKTGVICYREDVEFFREMLPLAKVFDFGKREDEKTQAKRLFSILRLTDKSDFEAIYAPMPSPSGLGLALYNRMIRAAAHKIIKL